MVAIMMIMMMSGKKGREREGEVQCNAKLFADFAINAIHFSAT